MGEVLDFLSRARKPAQAGGSDSQTASDAVVQATLDFSTIAEKNASVQERLRKERAQANENVLKSYRIK